MVQLPEELLSHICSYLRISAEPKASQDDRTKLSTLASISLSSRALSRAARPHLYRTLNISSCDSGSISQPITSTLIQQPDTAHLVHQLHTQTWQTRAELGLTNREPVPVPSVLKTQLLAAASSLGDVSARLKEDVQHGLRDGVEDAEYALLLCLCTNLEVWKSCAVYAAQESIVFDVVREAFIDQALVGTLPTSRPLQHVREVEIRHGDTEGSTNLGTIAEILKLPALEIFRGCMLKCNESTSLPQSTQSKVKRIYLESSLLDSTGLEQLLVACPNLETLSVHWGSSIVGVSRIQYDRMGEALRRHGTKLKNLRLRPEDAFAIDDNPDVYQPLGNLKELGSLRLLAVPYTVLLGGLDVSSDQSSEWLRETLPVSLRTLRISDADDVESESLDAQLLEVMKDEQFTELSTIRINRGEEFSEDAEDVGWDDSESTKFWVVLKRDREATSTTQN